VNTPSPGLRPKPPSTKVGKIDKKALRADIARRLAAD
jgi:non-ribosomal peptide synthetase component E (peptide arylation enzyme)